MSALLVAPSASKSPITRTRPARCASSSSTAAGMPSSVPTGSSRSSEVIEVGRGAHAARRIHPPEHRMQPAFRRRLRQRGAPHHPQPHAKTAAARVYAATA